MDKLIVDYELSDEESVEGADPKATEPDPLDAPAGKRKKGKGKGVKLGPGQIDWNVGTELILLNLVLKHKAYKKTEINMSEKWHQVTQELFEHAQFKGIYRVCSANSINRKFDRMYTDCATKYALDKEGANLSGLEQSVYATPGDKLLYAMIVEVLKSQREKEAKTKKDSERETSMLIHEQDILETPDNRNPKKRKSPGSDVSSRSSVDDFEEQFLQALRAPPPQVPISEIELDERRARIAREDAESAARIEAMKANSEAMKAQTNMMLLMLQTIAKNNNNNNNNT